MYHNIAIIGAGAIGQAMLHQLLTHYATATLYAFSRTPHTINTLKRQYENRLFNLPIDYENEHSLTECAHIASQQSPLDLVFVATGILHEIKQEKRIMPEKALHQISADKLARLLHVNTIIPTLLAKHFIPKLNHQNRSVFATLSARIGSLSDNRLGGWYAYRASKAALNMIIKTAAIETSRQNKQAIIVGLHPGTVDSPLSKPFQSNLPKGQLLTPTESASALLKTINQLDPQDSGKVFAFDGLEIQP